MIGISSVIFKIGNFEIKWYSVMVLIAAFLVTFFSLKEAERIGFKKDFVFNALFWSFIFGIVGARLYYVIFNFNYYLKNPIEIVEIWNGGLAIHGGLIAGCLTMLLYAKKYKVRCIRLLDVVSVPLLLASAIGRWGNFFNMEAYGPVTTVARLKALFVPDFVIEGMKIEGLVRVPTFYFESIFCLIGFLIILIIRRGKYVKVGMPTAFYLITYGTIRFFIEFYRVDALMIGSFRMAQIVSILMVITGIILLMYLSKKGKFEDLYNDPNNNIDIRY